jgi:beta-glucosidase
MMLGLSARLEGEEMPVDVPGFKGGDRVSLDLPAPQQELLEAVVAVGKPVILVLLNGSAPRCRAVEYVPAIVEVAPRPPRAPRWPMRLRRLQPRRACRRRSTHRSTTCSLQRLPDDGSDVSLLRATRSFHSGSVSATRASYSNCRCPRRSRAAIRADFVEVENAGTRAGDEVVQLT